MIHLSLPRRSYGVTLWFPTYVQQITTQRDNDRLEAFCNTTVAGSVESLEPYCDCGTTLFSDMEIEDTQFKNLRMDGVIFSNVSFFNVSFSSVVFNGTQFTDGCQFIESNISSSYFNATFFENITLDSVTIESSLLCSMNGSGLKVVSSTRLNASMLEEGALKTGRVKCREEDSDFKEIKCKSSNSQIYRDSFFVTASAFPGNVASAIAVYFLRRNYWLGKFLNSLQ